MSLLMRRGRFLSIFLLASVLGLPAIAQSPDEKTVKTTYAKLSYAVKIATVHEVLAANPKADASTIDARIANNDLRFELTNFSSGWLEAIRDQKYGEFV